MNCKQFEQGKCTRGLACKFIHEEPQAYFYGEQQNSQVFPPALSKQNATVPFSSWANVAKFPGQKLATTAPPPVAAQPPPSPPPAYTNPQFNQASWANKVPCKFFASDSGCRSGSACRFSHENEEATFAQERQQCGICLEDLKHKRIGLLTDCNHTFCFTCIRDWRQSDMSQVERTKEIVQTCPICRTRSFFILPSNFVPSTEEEKCKIIQAYRANCKSIPCKYGEQCPFGASCLFYHSAQQIDPAKLGLEFVKTADGLDKAISTKRAATLGDYLLL